jgi:predicted transposase/invertase (TIGR01784 family)
MSKLKQAFAELRAKAKRGELDGADLTTRLALWGAYVTNEGVDIVSEVMEKDKVFSEVMEAEKDYWGESRNRFIQMMQEKHERDAIWERKNAERKLLEAEKKALEAAEKALEKGMAEGMAKGKAEVALNLLRAGVDVDTIAKGTGLSVDEIKSLER